MLTDNERRQRLAFAIRAAMGKRSAEQIATSMRPTRSKETVARWARGDTVPSALDIGPLAAALGVRVEFLADPPDVPTYPLQDYLIPPEVVEEMSDLAREATSSARERIEEEAAQHRAAEETRAAPRRKRPA